MKYLIFCIRAKSNWFVFMSRSSIHILLYLIGQERQLAPVVALVVVQDLGLPGAGDGQLRLLHSQRPLAGQRGHGGPRRRWSRQEGRGDGVGAHNRGRVGGADGISTSV